MMSEKNDKETMHKFVFLPFLKNFCQQDNCLQQAY